MSEILILAVGNVLLRDDGGGIWLAHELLRRYDFDERVRIVDGGTLGMELLGELQADQTLIVIDALAMGGSPGDVRRLTGDEVPAALRLKLSVHDIAIADLLAAARLSGRLPRSIILWGFEPGPLAPGIGFTQDVKASLSRLESLIVDEIVRSGGSARRREHPGDLDLLWSNAYAQEATA